MGPLHIPIVTTLIVFVAVLVGAAAIGFRLLQSSAKRSGGIQVPSGSPPFQMGAVAAPPPGWGNTISNPAPPTLQPSPPESSLFCPRCGVSSGTDHCIGCGFDLRTLSQRVSSPQPALNPQPTLNPEPFAQQQNFNPRQPMPAAPAAAAKKRRQNGIWPIITDAASAKYAAKQGMGAAFFCAGLTVLFVLLARQGMSLVQGINERALVDAAVFAALGILILRMSRVAAVAALALYIVERIVMWIKISSVGVASIPMMIVIVLCFVSSIRGTFAYQRYKGSSYNI
jgi:hypothetical protein